MDREANTFLPTTKLSITWKLHRFRFSYEESDYFTFKIGGNTEECFTGVISSQPVAIFSKTVNSTSEFSFALEIWAADSRPYQAGTKELSGNVRFTILDEEKEEVRTAEVALASIGGATARNMVQLRDLEDLAINRYLRPPMAELVIPLTVLCEVEIHPYTALKSPGEVGSRLGEDFGSLLKSGELADFTILVDGHTFKCHKAVLAARSPVFKTMFTTDMQEKETQEVKIVDFPKRAIQLMLQYIYTGSMDENTVKMNSIQLLQLAEKYMLMGLKALCENALIDCLDRESCVKLLRVADYTRAQRLKISALRYICNQNFTKTDQGPLKDCLREYPDLLCELFVAKSSCVADQSIYIEQYRQPR